MPRRPKHLAHTAKGSNPNEANERLRPAWHDVLVGGAVLPCLLFTL
jgi:hypothetical protein